MKKISDAADAIHLNNETFLKTHDNSKLLQKVAYHLCAS